MRRVLPLILVVLIAVVSINILNGIINNQLNSIGATLGININPVKRGSALESNVRAWRMFIQDIRSGSSVDVDIDFNFNAFAIFLLSNQNIIMMILLIVLLAVIILLPRLAT